MTKQQRGRMVLVVDEDLGFVCWLGRLLADAGYSSLPALSCPEALSRVRLLGIKPDAVIADPALPNFHRMIQTLARAHAHMRLIAVRSPGQNIPPNLHPSVTLDRPLAEPESTSEWLRRIEQAFHDLPRLALKATNKR